MVLVVPEQSQRPYRFGMTLLCVGALFNWLGLADTYSDPVPAIRYIGVGLIAAGASLICMAMCFWMRNTHDPNSNADYDVSSDPIHIISADPSLEKPPEYSTVVDVPPCYEDAVKLSATPIMFRLKQALTSSGGHLINQNVETDGATAASASKNYAEQNHLLAATLPADVQDFGAATVDSARRRTEKGALVLAPLPSLANVSLPPPSQSQNSSQNENTLAKVFRKSIRGIRRYRSGSEDGNNSLGQAQASDSNLENGSVQEANTVQSTKVDR